MLLLLHIAHKIILIKVTSILKNLLPYKPVSITIQFQDPVQYSLLAVRLSSLNFLHPPWWYYRW